MDWESRGVGSEKLEIQIGDNCSSSVTDVENQGNAGDIVSHWKE